MNITSAMTQQRPVSTYADAFHSAAMAHPQPKTNLLQIPSRAVPLYTYRDFSSIGPELTNKDDDNDNDCGTNDKPPPVVDVIGQKLPVKMADILSRPEFEHIVSWLPHGRSFKIHKPHDFESIIMPRYFEHSNYHSFNRLLNAWSFRRISRGRDKGSYYHELFLKGMDHLHRHMRRLPKTHRKLPHDKSREPDFWSMPCVNVKDPSSSTSMPTSSSLSFNRQHQQQVLPMMNPLRQQGGVEQSGEENMLGQQQQQLQQQAQALGCGLMGNLTGNLPPSQENTAAGMMGLPPAASSALDVLRRKQLASSLSRETLSQTQQETPFALSAGPQQQQRQGQESGNGGRLTEMLRTREILHSLAVQEQEAKVRRLALIVQLRRNQEAEARLKRQQQRQWQQASGGGMAAGGGGGASSLSPSLPNMSMSPTLPANAFDGSSMSMSPSLLPNPSSSSLSGGMGGGSGPLSFNARLG